ncbi:MAG: D-glycero-beta-D-manno-heptose 1-phosphate adenylyltransferase [Candidatus Omnitrophica bacterium]|nr:D-glycero-beta-D-manno-heptose 1-phosphate adenylyltransferase [Candidatus Omnitrophota bacterium]
MKSKLKSLSAIGGIVSRLRRRDKKIVFTNGCFDIIHVGHVDYLSRARDLGDILVIGLNSDSSVRRLKGKGRPINKEKDRALILSALSFVDYIVIFGDDTPGNLIKKIKPDILVKGGDWKIKEIVGADFVSSYGGRVTTIPFVKGYSTTSIVERMKAK